MTHLDGIRIKAHVPGMAAKLRGVITNVPLEMSMEEVKEEIKGGKVVEAKRLQTNKSGVKQNSLSVLLVFDKLMPAEIHIGWINYKVREYIPQPLRCFKCQRMGHTAQQCKWRLRCAKCGGEHEYGKCDKDAKIKCCNCGGEHSEAFAGCVVQRQAKEVQRIKIINKVSYAEALKAVNINGSKQTRINELNQNISSKLTECDTVPQRSGLRQFQPGKSVPQEKTCRHKCNVQEDTMLVNKKSKVVNVAVQQEKKSDRIKIVVQAAEEFLGIKELKAEEIHAMLRASNDGGSLNDS